MKDAINKIVVTTEDNRALEITVLLVFELPEFNKKYVLYYLENDNADENVTMFISEFNPITNEIKEIDKDEIDIIKNVYLEIKKDALKDFEKAERQDLIDLTKREIEILQEYLPKQLSRDEVKAEVQKIISEIGATSMKDMGKVMKSAKEKIGAQADGRTINEVVKGLLA